MEMFGNRLRKVYRHLSKQAKRQGISCYRLYDRDLPEFPLIIDVYDDRVYLSEYKAKHTLTEEAYEAWLTNSLQVIADTVQVPDDRIYLKQRRRKEGRLDQYQKTGEEAIFFTVSEGGLAFKVNLTDYLDTGLFLDHRITRGMVKAEAAGKHMLNLFCYTGSFSVYAAAGGAASVTSVDLSKTYLGWAADNFQLNQLDDPARYHFIHADVIAWLDDVPPETYDIVVLDPPTFSNSKRMDDFFDIQRDHVPLVHKCLRAMKPGGTLYFSTNFTKFQLEKDSIPASVITDITKATTPFDFEGKLRRWCFKIVK